MSDTTLIAYKRKVKSKLNKLSDVFANASVGNFAEDIIIPKEEDEFSELYVGIQVMLEVIREQVAELQEVDRKKTEFLSMTAHQLRTPLGAIRWYIETLLNSGRYDVPPPIKEKLRNIHESNMRMIFLVNDLLDVSRIEQNRVYEEPQRIDILPIIEQLKEDLQYEIKNMQLNISIDASSPPPIIVDPHHFREVMYHLFSNAIKYSNKGGSVLISIDTMPLFVQIKITDTGIGIPSAEQNRIFEKFFRGSNAMLHDSQSTGLGLFIAQAYVKRWGGDIGFVSKINQGTSFTVTIPL